MGESLKEKPVRKGGKAIVTFEAVAHHFFVGRLTASELAAAAKISPTTARKVIVDALKADKLHISGERMCLTYTVALYSLGPEPEPKHRTYVGETDRDSGLVKLRELARLGPVNHYVQLEWAGERQ